ncbi:MAG: FeoB-associated Cys-rich membrane protein [Oscillospiraceae bacterium]|nr:FeoB-associated Cys-rich membrane protein [Oscillospiraceae bacterium]
MTAYDILVVSALIVFAAVAIYIMKRRKKKGRGCSGDCTSCNKCK